MLYICMLWCTCYHEHMHAMLHMGMLPQRSWANIFPKLFQQALLGICTCNILRSDSDWRWFKYRFPDKGFSKFGADLACESP